jgi:hypothetical protein
MPPIGERSRGKDATKTFDYRCVRFVPTEQITINSHMMEDVIMRNNETALLPTEGRPGTATARLISGSRGAIWPFAGPSASTVVSA